MMPTLAPELIVTPELLTNIEETGQVIVHASITCKAAWELVRIWQTTYLVDTESNRKSALLHVSNVAVAPNWTPIVYGQTLRFTLVFEALPKSCSRFHFMEVISEPGGFLIENIQRNQSDVYQIDLTNTQID